MTIKGARRARARHGVAWVMSLVGALALAFGSGSTAQGIAGPGRADLGASAFWIHLRAHADLTGADSIRDWRARGAFVVERLRSTADMSQAALRADLRRRGLDFTPFWITNAIRVTGGPSVMDELARRADVAAIHPDRTVQIERAPRNSMEAAVEWNIQRIGADDVWNQLGIRGRGSVVALIDTGVEFRHPALFRQYRGFRGASFVHDYNWFDPSSVCDPPTRPCDNVNHGTHIMGTAVGEDPSMRNQIGVAPRARWIAAKGCESVSCSTSALLASGQWMLAPTDLNGENPRPDLRPHVIDSPWGGGPGDPFFRDMVVAWVAAGIFPIFPAGASGPSCGSIGSPADYPNAYAVGAFDMSDNIATFSGRGPSVFGVVKPNVAAPGVNIRSSSTDGDYVVFSGTSMATSHVAGTVALMLAANPDLIGDPAATGGILDGTAVDVSNLACGGTADDNNVWGEGILDAFAAVEAAIG